MADFAGSKPHISCLSLKLDSQNSIMFFLLKSNMKCILPAIWGCFFHMCMRLPKGDELFCLQCSVLYFLSFDQQGGFDGFVFKMNELHPTVIIHKGGQIFLRIKGDDMNFIGHFLFF